MCAGYWECCLQCAQECREAAGKCRTEIHKEHRSNSALEVRLMWWLICLKKPNKKSPESQASCPPITLQNCLMKQIIVFIIIFTLCHIPLPSKMEKNIWRADFPTPVLELSEEGVVPLRLLLALAGNIQNICSLTHGCDGQLALLTSFPNPKADSSAVNTPEYQTQ